MRVGDVYKIERLVKNGEKDDEILKAFKNDYSEDEIKKFIKSAKANVPVDKPAAKPAVKKREVKKTDPLS